MPTTTHTSNGTAGAADSAKVQADEVAPENAWDALARLQGDLPVIGFDRENPHYHNKYATLAAVVSEARPILRRHGFSWTAPPKMGESGLILDYKLRWKDGTVVEEGQWPLGGGNIQQLGSAITYGRRYCFCAVLNIVSDEDSDAEVAQAPRPPVRSAPQRPAPPRDPVIEDARDSGRAGVFGNKPPAWRMAGDCPECGAKIGGSANALRCMNGHTPAGGSDGDVDPNDIPFN